MMMDRKFSLDDLDGIQRELAEIIGIDKYLEVAKAFGGSTIYIIELKTALRPDRNREIREKFDGYNFRELSLEYDLSERTIREIVAPITKTVRNRPGAGQISLFSNDCY